MPYVLQNPDDEEQKKQGANVSGTDATGDLGSGASASGLSPQQSGVSGWTDMKAYLDANKDQTVGMAQKLGSKLSGEANQLEGQIGQSEKDFEKNVDSNRIDYDPDMVEGAFKDPDAFVKDDANVDKFIRQRDAAYKGPNSLNDADTYGTLKSKVDQGAQRAGLVDTEGGRKQLLFETGDNPTQGQTTLDSALLSGSPEARDILKGGASKFGTLQSFLDSQADTASKYAGAAKGATEATGKTVKDRLATEIPAFQKGVDDRVTESRNNAASLTATATQKFLQGQDLTPEEANAIGIGSSFKTDLQPDITGLKNDYGVRFDMNPFMSTDQSPDIAINRANVASGADYAKAAALARLSGSDMSGFLNPADASKAGTAADARLAHFDMPGAATSSHNMLGQKDANYIADNPKPSADPAKKSIQLDLIARNPRLLVDPTWELWYEKNKTGTMGIGPKIPSSGDKGSYSAGGNSFTDPTTGRRVS